MGQQFGLRSAGHVFWFLHVSVFMAGLLSAEASAGWLVSAGAPPFSSMWPFIPQWASRLFLWQSQASKRYSRIIQGLLMPLGTDTTSLLWLSIGSSRSEGQSLPLHGRNYQVIWQGAHREGSWGPIAIVLLQKSI